MDGSPRVHWWPGCRDFTVSAHWRPWSHGLLLLSSRLAWSDALETKVSLHGALGTHAGCWKHADLLRGTRVMMRVALAVTGNKFGKSSISDHFCSSASDTTSTPENTGRQPGNVFSPEIARRLLINPTNRHRAAALHRRRSSAAGRQRPVAAAGRCNPDELLHILVAASVIRIVGGIGAETSGQVRRVEGGAGVGYLAGAPSEAVEVKFSDSGQHSDGPFYEPDEFTLFTNRRTTAFGVHLCQTLIAGYIG
ncbi:valine--tRNA ligase [Striga asiatica]|uniref:Valine--tRNA ligase n=1 Tax=Striga asiatica TaxID=4170 RepID=A0A5A7PK06_STRAF|nr:valine--tRNA ligase [Striga asiatica]